MVSESLYNGQIVLCVLSFIVLYWIISRDKGPLWVIPVVCVLHAAWWWFTGDKSLVWFIAILLVGFVYRLWERRGKKSPNEEPQEPSAPLHP